MSRRRGAAVAIQVIAVATLGLVPAAMCLAEDLDPYWDFLCTNLEAFPGAGKIAEKLPERVALDMGSTESQVHGKREGSGRK